ncbi:MAG: hypothetical protein LBS77_05430 [Desulfovibrio sp.]|nr:hypothetical protein [Desulfovibrio sp.]
MFPDRFFALGDVNIIAVAFSADFESRNRQQAINGQCGGHGFINYNIGETIVVVVRADNDFWSGYFRSAISATGSRLPAAKATFTMTCTHTEIAPHNQQRFVLRFANGKRTALLAPRKRFVPSGPMGCSVASFAFSSYSGTTILLSSFTLSPGTDFTPFAAK